MDCKREVKIVTLLIVHCTLLGKGNSYYNDIQFGYTLHTMTCKVKKVALN
uniref:Uncharacterized protein n=1 Tax=Medicago truncatula TaxID=3880 RepID=A4PSE5_MEDTR|nr:hypothetical protein MtrDRAFT_AC140550g33v2 [Medicago truncatula]